MRKRKKIKTAAESNSPLMLDPPKQKPLPRTRKSEVEQSIENGQLASRLLKRINDQDFRSFSVTLSGKTVYFFYRLLLQTPSPEEGAEQSLVAYSIHQAVLLSDQDQAGEITKEKVIFDNDARFYFKIDDELRFWNKPRPELNQRSIASLISDHSRTQQLPEGFRSFCPQKNEKGTYAYFSQVPIGGFEIFDEINQVFRREQQLANGSLTKPLFLHNETMALAPGEMAEIDKAKAILASITEKAPKMSSPQGTPTLFGHQFRADDQTQPSTPDFFPQDDPLNLGQFGDLGNPSNDKTMEEELLEAMTGLSDDSNSDIDENSAINREFTT